ncbi:little elongation complex subunit 1 isoform X1 [Bactrocera dorsalis]|uniref:Little elongation complex subunit 1 isoform X1 n=2 Tax=Bactrocera dorsalis TaxID=27457 RepID=A0A6I9VG98_BACDO|nr:little elongation complex subunit 1 isoform X1 [Bactrocera dorsalis]
MTDEEHPFNYDDLNLDFLELSPPSEQEVQKSVTATTNKTTIRAKFYKAKDLAQRIAQCNELVNKIDLLKMENSNIQLKLRDFQKSANQIHKLYENEKKKCLDLQMQYQAVEIKSNNLHEHCARLENEVSEKEMQLEQLEAQLDNTKGPLSFTELAIKYLKLVQKLNEDETLKLYDKPLLDNLSNYCEQRGMKVPLMKVRAKNKRKLRKDKDIQCNLLNSSDTPVTRQVAAQSTQTSVILGNHMHTQTVTPLARDMCAQTMQTEEIPIKSMQNQAVQTNLIQLCSQGTQHISTTTTRGTSTSCFIKKHNVGTIFPEPKLIPLEAALVDKFFEVWNVSPLSPISDPIPETTSNEFDLSKATPLLSLPDKSKSIGTCTYLCNVQRQIDYIPIMEPFKRSQSSSPSPIIHDNVKYEINATPSSTPPPPPLSTTQLNENTETSGLPTNNNLNNISNLQPMISALTNFPEMHPDVFSTVWQMAGQMFMGLLYSPTSNHLRAQQFNRPNDSHTLQQFNNWIRTLYESRQISQQQATSPLPTQCEQQINSRENTFDLNRVINTNVTQSSDVSTQFEGTPRETAYDSNSNPMNDLSDNNISADGSTQTHGGCEDFEKCIFKEPLEIPKRSVKQVRGQKIATKQPIVTRKRKNNKQLKKRYKIKRAKLVATSITNGETDSKSDNGEVTGDQNENLSLTAVEFCANLYSSNQDYQIENDRNGAVSESVYSAHLEDDCGNESVNVKHTEDEKINNTINDLDINAEKDRPNSLCSNENQLRLLQDKRSANMVMSEDIKVPELYDSERSKCDSSEMTDARCSIENQQEVFEKQNKQKRNLAYNIFGSDSDDSDVDITQTNSSLQEQRDTNSPTQFDNIFISNDVNTEMCAVLKQQKKNIYRKERLESDMLEETKNIDILTDISESTHNQEELKENEAEVSSMKFTDPLQKINNSADISKHLEEIRKFKLPNILPPDTNELTKGTEGTKLADTYKHQLPIKATEFQQNEAISFTSTTTVTIQPLYNSHNENEEVDEPILVVVEGTPEKICKNRTHSDSSEDYDAASNDRISQTSAKDLSPPSSSDSEIPVLPAGSVMDDLLGNSPTKQVVNSIFESANEQNVPYKRGRKRKHSMTPVALCKRSARLRDKQKRDNTLSNDEGLSSPTKDSNGQKNLPTQSINDDSCKDNEQNSSNLTGLCQAKDKMSHSSTSELTNHQFEISVMKQRSNKGENYEPQSISEMPVSWNGTFENTSAVANTLNGMVNQPFFRPFEEFVTVTKTPAICHSEHLTPQIVQSVSTSKCTLASSSELSLEIGVQIPKHDSTVNQLHSESPNSPPLETVSEKLLVDTQITPTIPLERNRSHYPSIQKNSVLQNFIRKYSFELFATITVKSNKSKLESNIALQIADFLNKTRGQMDVTASTLAASLLEQMADCEILASLIIEQICKAPRPEIELNCVLTRVPPKYIGTHLRLISMLLRHLQQKRPEFIAALLLKIENRLFSYMWNEKLSLNTLLNLTQLYLIGIPLHNAAHNPARLFIAKSLYYHNKRASAMIYEVLCWYPTTLPHRDESNYDKSDALITVIQHLLMTTTYDMDSKDLRHRELLSMLRFEYHFEPFKPTALEVLTNLVTKLKSGNLTNLMYAFAIFCKRNLKLVDNLLQQHLLPLAEEYYKRVQHTNEYDERIAVLMDCISAVVKPLPLTTDVSVYFSIFERFLSAVQRPVVQEAAVLAILRFQRFGQIRCFHALANFKPHYPLQMVTINALKTFVHKKPLKYWNGLMPTISN